MKSIVYLFRPLLTAVFIALFLHLSVYAGVVELKGNHASEFTILQDDFRSFRFSNTLDGFDFFDVKTNQGIFTQIMVSDYGFSIQEGNPKLPVLRKLIEMPHSGNFEVNIISMSHRDIYLGDYGILNQIIPAQPPVSKNIEDPSDIEFIVNKETYQKDEFFALEPVSFTEIGMMRSVRLGRLEVSPFQYNPVTNTLRIIEDIQVDIVFTGSDVMKTMEAKKELFSPYYEGIFGFLTNYKPMPGDELIMDEPVTYIIISDPMFQAALQPFIQWKVKKGFYVIEGYTNNPAVGTTTTSIKAYLKNLYDNPPAGVNPQSFVLFVGDVAQIPTFNGTAGSHVSDLYYCDYTGDIYPECYYGRFSATNLAQLQPQIDKTLEYEQYLMPDKTFLDEVVMVAGADASHSQTWGNGQINYGTTYYFNLAHGLTSHTYLQPEPGGANYSQQIRQNVSDGVSYANYTAHCSTNGWADPSFTISHIAALTNAHKYPLMVGNCCSSLEFQTNCFGEEILRAADKGALGYIGGSNSTYWDEDFWWGVGFESISANPVYNPAHLGAYDRTFHDHGEPLAQWYVTQGQMPSAGNLAVTQAGSSMETYYWEIYHLMGDPSLMVYFSQPPVTTATYDPLMPLGTASFTVNTQPYAYVAISKGGVLHGAAVANASGTAVVNLVPITVPGQADIVVTRQNGEPFIGNVVVASPNGPYVLLDAFQIDDNAGNNNGQADFGENILLDVTLENVGSTTGTNLMATLISADPDITITDNSQAWPNIAPQATSSQNGAFAFTVSDDIEDQHVVQFDIEVTDGNETWFSIFSITVNAPFLQAGNNMTINDAVSGNGNGMLDPGETADVIIQAINSGHSASPSAFATLYSNSSYVTVNNGSFNLGIIGAGASASATFNITVNPATPVGTPVDLNFDVIAGSYNAFKTYYQGVGLMVEDWETGGFLAFPWQSGGDANWLITQSNPYEGVYCAQSGDIDDYEISELFLTVVVTVDDSISFYRKVSSESNYDYLQFWIDGNMMEEWAGEVGWGKEVYPVTAGLHTFKWVFDKDVSLSSGSDCGWIDYIIFPPLGPIEPDISVNPVSLDFGDVIVGTNSTEVLTISNNGSDNLTGNVMAPAGFTVSDGTEAKGFKESGKNTISFVVSPGGNKEIFVTFEPTSYICYSDNMEVTSNDPDNALIYVPVAGCGVIGPDISVNPASFNVGLPPGGTVTKTLSVINSGDSQLDYNAHIVYTVDAKTIVNVYPQSVPYWTGTTNGTTKTQDSKVIGHNTEDGWFRFDISGIPYGSTINSVKLHAYVYETYYPYWSATSLPMDPVSATASEIKTWVQGNSASGTAYYYGNESSSFPTGWHDWTLSAQANADLEAALQQGWFAVGVDSRDNSSSYYIKFEGWNETNKPYLEVDYTYNPPYTWLLLNGGMMTSGSVPEYSSEDIMVQFDAGSLPQGVYTADIYINNNDPNDPLITVPVTLTISTGYELSLKVMLEGPFESGEMGAYLCLMPEFSMVQPFNTSPWNYSGIESITVMPNPDIVDWVLVELRDADVAANATGAATVWQQAGFVLKNGSIVSIDGVSPMMFNVQVNQNLFAVVCQRNHLDIMSGSPLTQSGSLYSYDFTTGLGQVYGGALGHKQLAPGVWGMVGGDGLPDGQVGNSDKVDVWVPQSGSSGYLFGDFSMDGQVNNLDKVEVWSPNSGSGSQVPDNGYKCQVPE
ncbi:MAG: choice-of-anchor D domain-containing protein [Bacteroidales bacterium]|nr:choice-of-anchor D domain-containing protein [Bacteroidales bacterium]